MNCKEDQIEKECFKVCHWRATGNGANSLPYRRLFSAGAVTNASPQTSTGTRASANSTGTGTLPVTVAGTKALAITVTSARRYQVAGNHWLEQR